MQDTWTQTFWNICMFKHIIVKKPSIVLSIKAWTFFQSKLESAEKDLRQYEAVSKMGLLHNGDSSFDTDSITNLGISRRHSLGGRTVTMDTNRDTSRKSKSQRERDDLNMQLRDELQRALQVNFVNYSAVTVFDVWSISDGGNLIIVAYCICKRVKGLKGKR